MKTYSVGQIINYTKNLLVNDYFLKSIYVTGEISNCKYHSMGHIYFSLKDEVGSMPAVMFKGNTYSGLKFRLADGQAVIMKCSIGMYEKTSALQLYVTEIHLAEDKEGKLNAEFLKLKERLNDEGLFDFDKKKNIVKYPKTVGIVTASTGAAVQDIMNIAKRRNPYVQLILYPARVQGEGAAATIAKGIEVLDKMNLDTIIIGRGGGSIEDLWAFNEEIVARAIYNAATPIISGTGHETDTTIADYVADMRAPTPSAAAELAIPDVMSGVNTLRMMRNRIDSLINNKISVYMAKRQILREKIERVSPGERLRNKQLRLADSYERLHLLMKKKYEDTLRKYQEYETAERRLVKDIYQKKLHRFQVDVAKLDGLSPTAKLINGFGYIRMKDEPLRETASLSPGDKVDITLHDGSFSAEVLEVQRKE
ncbi:Exodeoxyribonuclease VII large subunit [Eubacterium ruminantium]|nr:Exodeoxyribonuclease VII large subunit [Eubacterium ruminantium]